MLIGEYTNTQLVEDLKWIGLEIGNTPLIPFTKLEVKPNVKLFAKAEWAQLSSSVKARAAFNIMLSAAQNGEFAKGRKLLDATSGNTGIAYAAIGFKAGIPVTLCIPENASAERIAILKSLNAEIIFTSKFGGTDEAQEAAYSLAQNSPDEFFYANQYSNDNNWKAHYHTTANEIFDAQPGITHFVCGLGTSGTFTGTGRRLKELNPAIQLIALQPDFPLHGMEGWKHLETALVPPIYDDSLADATRLVSTEQAYKTLVEVAAKENMMLSPSSAANLAGALQLASEINEGSIVTVLPDNADKYGEIINQLF